jgi:alpha-L-fucosidase 2
MCLWAILGDGDRSLVLADMLLSYLDSDSKSGNGGTYPNLLCACPPAQMDGNFGYVAAVNEMLVQEKDGQVALLPALPKLWRSGKIKGIRINGSTVDIEWCDGKIVSSHVKCEKL